jgi:WD40 repeat protein
MRIFEGGSVMLTKLFRVVFLLCASLLVFSPAQAVAPAQPLPEPFEIVPVVPPSEIADVAFSPDGTRFISGGGDPGDVQIWNVASGRLIRDLEADTQIFSVTSSADGRQVLAAVSGSDNKNGVVVWDAATGNLLHTLTGHKDYAYLVVASRDGHRWLSASRDSVRLWDAETAKLIASYAPSKSCGVALTARFVGAVPDVLFNAAAEQRSHFCDLAMGKPQTAFPLKDPQSAAISRDGKQVLIGNDGSVALYDVASGKKIHAYEMDRRNAISVALSPDGTRVASGDFNNTIRVWDAKTGKLLRTQYHTGTRQTENWIRVAFSPDGKILATAASDLTIKFWDADSGRLIRTIGGATKAVLSVAYSPDGTSLLTGSDDGRMRLWDLARGRLTRTFDTKDAVWSVAFSRDGTLALSGDGDKMLRLWRVASGQLLRDIRVSRKTNANHGPETADIAAVAISPDNTRLLSGADIPKLWDAGNGYLIHDYQSDALPGWGVGGASFSPDGERIAFTVNQKLAIGDVATGKLIRVIDIPDYGTSTRYSPDGKTLLVAGRKSTELREAASGALLRTFDGVKGVFSRDGAFVLTLDDDELKLWQTTTGKLIKDIETGYYDINGLALAPDARHAVTVHADSGVRVWKLNSDELLVSFFGAIGDEWLAITPEGYFAGSDKGADLISIVRGLAAYSVDQFYQTLYRPDLVRQKLSGDPYGLYKEAARGLNLETVLRSGAAPRVVIESPSEGSAQHVGKIEVQIQLQDRGGGFGRIEWRVNGITMGIRDPSRAGPISVSGRLSRSLPVAEGTNLIEIVAYNAKNLIASQRASVVVEARSAGKTAQPGLFVLAVGVNDYREPRLKLKFAAPDAKAMIAAFTQGGRELYRTIETRTILDSDVTAPKLAAAFDDLGSRMQPSDIFVLFMAGHGATEDGRYYFIPSAFHYTGEDAIRKSAIGQNQFQGWLSRIPALRSVLIYDTCESGSAGAAARFRGEQRAVATARLTRSMGRTVLSATLDNAPALEGYKNHGVFTWAILDAMTHADSNNDQRIEVTELARYLEANVPAITQTLGLRQLPQISMTGGDFSLVARLPEPGR